MRTISTERFRRMARARDQGDSPFANPNGRDPFCGPIPHFRTAVASVSDDWYQASFGGPIARFEVREPVQRSTRRSRARIAEGGSCPA